MFIFCGGWKWALVCACVSEMSLPSTCLLNSNSPKLAWLMPKMSCRGIICTLLDARLYLVLKNSFDLNGSSWSGLFGALIVIL